jgi:hypothetical protein
MPYWPRMSSVRLDRLDAADNALIQLRDCLIWDDNGTLRMDSSEILDGVPGCILDPASQIGRVRLLVLI